MLLLVPAICGVRAAQSSFPGRNGEIAFSIVLPNSYAGVLGDSSAIDIDICAIRPDTKMRSRLTGPGSGSSWWSGATWTADGEALAFRGDNGFDSFIALLRPSDRAPKLVANAFGRSPTWAPDGAQLAYVSRDGELRIIDRDGGELRVLAARAADPAWSPDGTRIAYVEDGQVVVVDAAGGGRRMLTSDLRTHASPNWSPDGGRLVFVSSGAGQAPVVEVVNADGGGRAVLRSVRSTNAFESPGFVDPTWSPDGTKIAFLQRQEESDATDIYTMNTDGTGVTNVTTSPFYEFSIDWRPLPTSGFLSQTPTSCGVGGTPRADTLTGTRNDDVVYALAGDDRISTGAGQDIVLGDAGDDTIRLGSGSDDLAFGGAGRDLLDGGDGPDGLYGGPGSDRLLGGSGDDELRGEAGDDVITGGPGNDTLVGGAGDDVVNAVDGSRDNIRCGVGRDLVFADGRDRVDRDCERIVRR
ncbi:MAG: hypothetical protein ACJ757_08590 [Gaiellaceae bacterium]